MTNLQNHVTTLEWSEKLKEVGVPQEGLYIWKRDEGEAYLVHTNSRYISTKGEIVASAFLLSELIELAGEDLGCLYHRRKSLTWSVENGELDKLLHGKTPIDALSALVYEKYNRLKNV